METIVLRQHQLDALLDYSASIPTGKILGKKWKCWRGDGWFLGEYVPDPRVQSDHIGIKWRRILLVSLEEENKQLRATLSDLISRIEKGDKTFLGDHWVYQPDISAVRLDLYHRLIDDEVPRSLFT